MKHNDTLLLRRQLMQTAQLQQAAHLDEDAQDVLDQGPVDELSLALALDELEHCILALLLDLLVHVVCSSTHGSEQDAVPWQ